MREADCLLVDGTTWTNNEMQTRGAGNKLASEMGHLPQSGSGGMIEELAELKCRKILIHINNTNPILDENSEQRATLASLDIEVAEDGIRDQPRSRGSEMCITDRHDALLHHD